MLTPLQSFLHRQRRDIRVTVMKRNSLSTTAIVLSTVFQSMVLFGLGAVCRTYANEWISFIPESTTSVVSIQTPYMTEGFLADLMGVGSTPSLADLSSENYNGFLHQRDQPDREYARSSSSIRAASHRATVGGRRSPDSLLKRIWPLGLVGGRCRIGEH